MIWAESGLAQAKNAALFLFGHSYFARRLEGRTNEVMNLRGGVNDKRKGSVDGWRGGTHAGSNAAIGCFEEDGKGFECG